jgi:hypothetical protein
MGQYRLVGHLTRMGEPTVFLSKGTELYIVRPGEAVEGQIHVVGIADNTVTLRDAVSQAERAIVLTKGNGPP